MTQLLTRPQRVPNQVAANRKLDRLLTAAVKRQLVLPDWECQVATIHRSPASNKVDSTRWLEHYRRRSGCAASTFFTSDFACQDRQLLRTFLLAGPEAWMSLAVAQLPTANSLQEEKELEESQRVLLCCSSTHIQPCAAGAGGL